MADKTKIEWTEATWNIVNGCSVHSPGCTNCYAMKLAGTRLRNHPSRSGLTQDTKAGPVWTGKVRFNEQWLDQPLRWRAPRLIFVCAHGDLFHESVPDEWIDRVFVVMAQSRKHTFQVLTKRAGRMREYLSSFKAAPAWDGYVTRDGKPASGGPDMNPSGMPVFSPDRWPLPNVWLGVSVEDQQRADERREDFAATPAAIKFVSYEPALGPVDWRGWEFVHQIISGGESGPKARPSHPDWHRSARDFCAANGIAYFFKQWGEWAPLDALRLDGEPAVTDGPVTTRKGDVRDWMNRYTTFANDAGALRLRGYSFTQHSTDLVYRLGKKRAGRLLDGVEHNGMPVR
ncbi:phage Gp37/Gp68 family protein [Croceibacterium aestuarii]|uniref:phage Gp37/Gp68 family protein n=1 Tax=Croceibacterium aestuarii TaxID=3064139 RepID=UPI00272E14F3|nr:phage Gp37/Gp68 family protein [Croceibacterium sp. D39]